MIFRQYKLLQKKKWDERFRQKFEYAHELDYDENHLYGNDIMRVDLAKRWKYRKEISEYLIELLTKAYPTQIENNFRNATRDMIISESEFADRKFKIGFLGFSVFCALPTIWTSVNAKYLSTGYSLFSVLILLKFTGTFYVCNYVLMSDRLLQLCQIGKKFEIDRRTRKFIEGLK